MSPMDMRGRRWPRCRAFVVSLLLGYAGRAQCVRPASPKATAPRPGGLLSRRGTVSLGRCLSRISVRSPRYVHRSPRSSATQTSARSVPGASARGVAAALWTVWRRSSRVSCAPRVPRRGTGSAGLSGSTSFQLRRAVARSRRFSLGARCACGAGAGGALRAAAAIVPPPRTLRAPGARRACARAGASPPRAARRRP